jgi:PAS domain S-box-containing protein
MSGSDESVKSKPSEAELRPSGDHYRSVAEAAIDAIITINSQSTILIVNPAAEKIFGYSPHEMLGRQLTMLMPKYHRHLHREGIARYLETGHRHLEWGAVQVPGLHKDGEEISLEISFLEFTKDGQRFFTGIVRKLPDRNHGSVELSKDGDLMSAIVNQTNVGISVVDLKGRFTFANERYCQLVGRAREDLLTTNMADITHTDDLPDFQTKLEGTIVRGDSFEIDKRYVRPDHSWFWVHDSVSVLRNPAGVSIGVMSMTLALIRVSSDEALLGG